MAFQRRLILLINVFQTNLLAVRFSLLVVANGSGLLVSVTTSVST